MGFFDKLFSGKSKETELGAPAAGEAVPIGEVSDPTFGEEILARAWPSGPLAIRYSHPATPQWT